MTKLKRGQKRCSKCRKINAARSYKCKHCLVVFKSKNKSKLDWTTLKKGDHIKVLCGSGPYWISKRTGERIPMGEYGKFIVDKITSEGIHAYELGYSDHTYIYMGKDKRGITSSFLTAHRIREIKK
jgi:hypothetical protein